jgi:hypothetical protein
MTTNGFVLHDSATAPAASAAILDSIQKGWGFVPNLHRVLAESPAALEAYATLWGIAEKTGFTAVERNVVYLSIIYEDFRALFLSLSFQQVIVPERYARFVPPKPTPRLCPRQHLRADARRSA